MEDRTTKELNKEVIIVLKELIKKVESIELEVKAINQKTIIDKEVTKPITDPVKFKLPFT